MIWFYLAGLITGAVGWHMMVLWIGGKFEKEKKMKELKGEKTDDRGGV